MNKEAIGCGVGPSFLSLFKTNGVPCASVRKEAGGKRKKKQASKPKERGLDELVEPFALVVQDNLGVE